MSIFNKIAAEAARNAQIAGLKSFADYNKTVRQLMLADGGVELRKKGIDPKALQNYGVIVVSSQSHVSKTTQKGGNGKMSWEAAKAKGISTFDKKSMSSLGGKLYFAELKENSKGMKVPVSLARIEQENLLLKSWVSASGKTQEELYQLFLKGNLSFQSFVFMLFNEENSLFEWTINEGANKGVEAAVFTLKELEAERSNVVDDYSFLVENDDATLGTALSGYKSALTETDIEPTSKTTAADLDLEPYLEVLSELEGDLIARAKELGSLFGLPLLEAIKIVKEYDKALA